MAMRMTLPREALQNAALHGSTGGTAHPRTVLLHLHILRVIHVSWENTAVRERHSFSCAIGGAAIRAV
jgi:hypothetical protein